MPALFDSDGPGSSAAPIGSTKAVRVVIPSVTVATSESLNCGSAGTQPMRSPRIRCRIRSTRAGIESVIRVPAMLPASDLHDTNGSDMTRASDGSALEREDRVRKMTAS